MIIKNIWDKIYFHPLFYIIVIFSLFTAHFRELFYFTIIIFIHELGHSVTGIILGCKLKRIEIYPFGGCSKLEYDINIDIKKEILILMMGPLTQIIFMLMIYIFKLDVPNYFYTFNRLILIFNLLPIYPLDGGKIFNLLLNYFTSYYKSLKIIIYFSYFLYTIFIFLLIAYNHNLTMFLVLLSLGICLINEIKYSTYYFNKFILERYINNYNFKKSKIIKNVFNMKRNYIHTFLINKKFISEKEYLKNILFKY